MCEGVCVCVCVCDLRELVEEFDTDAFGRVRVLNHPHILRPRHMELRV